MPSNQSRTARRIKEDNLAITFIGIVAVFLLCHMPRLFLALHEAWITDQTLKCRLAEAPAFPLWALMGDFFSHLLLTFNSSVNSLIYCILSSHFRKVALKKCRQWGLVRGSRNQMPAVALAAATSNQLETRHISSSILDQNQRSTEFNRIPDNWTSPPRQISLPRESRV